MTMSNRSKFGLVLMSIAIICIAYTWIKFDEAKKSAAEDEFADLERDLEDLLD
tara:strand:- start:922 stop:1080 length:159 start_codon:yes stop_codon:yes gene_type:complete